MSEEYVTVYVNERPVRIFRGLRVKHALLSCDQSLYDRVADGRARVEDERGFPVGMEGALKDGARFVVRLKG